MGLPGPELVEQEIFMAARLRGVGRYATVVLVAAALLALTGCAPGRGTATGKVTYQAKPLVCGSVVFVGRDKRPITAAIATDGTFTANGVLEGANQVAVHSPDPISVVPIDKFGRPREKPEVDPKLWFPIPEKYSEADKSGLECTIRRNTTNPVNLDLQ